MSVFFDVQCSIPNCCFYLIITASESSFVAHPATCSMDTGGTFPGFKQHKFPADYLRVFSAKLRNALSYNSTPPMFSVAVRSYEYDKNSCPRYHLNVLRRSLPVQNAAWWSLNRLSYLSLALYIYNENSQNKILRLRSSMT
jgi:hypothetical protein